MILSSLDEPKTFAELCRLLDREVGMKNARSSVLYALRELIGQGQVVGIIDEESLKKTGKKLVPVFKLTGNQVIFLGGSSKDHPTDGSDYSIMKLYTDEKGNFIGKQYFKKIKRRSYRGETYRRISPLYLLHGDREWAAPRDIRNIRDLERRLRRKGSG